MPSHELDGGSGWPGRSDWTGRRGTKIDLHCHSTFSRETASLLPGISWRPLLEPEESYDLAKARGMDFVTLTDHDTIDGCLALRERRGDPPDFLVGEEVSVRFPEDGTILHVNVFGHDEAEHAEIQRLRGNIYDLVDYLRRIDRLYSVNHLTWTRQHRVLKSWQIETLLELFPAFEALNGTRSYAHNAVVWQATRGRRKVLLAGSDSHTDRVGTTYTLSAGTTRDELLASLKAGVAAVHGAFGTPEKLRDDVWAVLHGNIERRMAEATGRWERLVCRTLDRVGKALHPLACLGYRKHQNVLIRGFSQALAAG